MISDVHSLQRGEAAVYAVEVDLPDDAPQVYGLGEVVHHGGDFFRDEHGRLQK